LREKKGASESNDYGCVCAFYAFDGLNSLHDEFGEFVHVGHFEVGDNIVQARDRVNHADAADAGNCLSHSLSLP